MEEIKKDDNEEEILLKVKFSLPLVLHAIFIFCLAVFVVAIFFAASYYRYLFVYTLSIFFTCLIIYVVIICTTYFSECVVTNKEIKGKKFVLFGVKTYKYRFDLIYNIESVNLFGINNIVVKFSQGSVFEKVYRPKLVLQFVDNCDSVLKKLDNILTETKSDKNLITELALRQSQALSYIGDSILNSKRNNSIKK